jgi:hypothetical protein
MKKSSVLYQPRYSLLEKRNITLERSLERIPHHYPFRHKIRGWRYVRTDIIMCILRLFCFCKRNLKKWDFAGSCSAAVEFSTFWFSKCRSAQCLVTKYWYLQTSNRLRLTIILIWFTLKAWSCKKIRVIYTNKSCWVFWDGILCRWEIVPDVSKNTNYYI